MSSQTSETVKQSARIGETGERLRLCAVPCILLFLCLGACGSKSEDKGQASTAEQKATSAAAAGSQAEPPAQAPDLPTTPPPTLTLPAAGLGSAPIITETGSPLPLALPLQAIGTVKDAPWLKGAERAVSFRRGNKLFIAIAGPGWLRIVTPDGTKVAETDGLGSAQALEAIDIDGDKNVELVVGRGRSKHALSAPHSLFIYRFDGSRFQSSESIDLPPSPQRPVLVDVADDPKKKGFLWVAAFDSRKEAALIAATRDPKKRTWKAEVIDHIGVPWALASGDPNGDGTTDLFVARPNGEDQKTIGDLFMHRRGALNEMLPTRYGAHDMVVYNNQLIATDGWHYNFGRQARALVTKFVFENGKWNSQVLINVERKTGYQRVRLGDVNGDGKIDAVAAGNGPAIVVPSLEPVSGYAPALGPFKVETHVDDILPVDLDGNGRDEVLLLGPKPGIWQADE